MNKGKYFSDYFTRREENNFASIYSRVRNCVYGNNPSDNQSIKDRRMPLSQLLRHDMNQDNNMKFPNVKAVEKK